MFVISDIITNIFFKYVHICIKKLGGGSLAFTFQRLKSEQWESIMLS